ncbi:MAG: hypothetical protein OXJ90_06365 [Spirochaetaceae bacterium]|nr:hypothetical protein [Spirochaetaceae bacterium]
MAVVLGAVGLSISWVPFLGLVAIPTAVIGLLLSGVGLLLALTRKVNGYGLSILGGALCVVAGIVAIGSTSMAEAAVNSVLETAISSVVETATESALQAVVDGASDVAVDAAVDQIVDRLDAALATIVEAAMTAIDTAAAVCEAADAP